ncbi:MAG: long-chain fatty acid--CoA ligase [Alphaproteobacteria bacterium]
MTQVLPDIERLDTLPKLLVHNAERYGQEVAVREKEFGIWNEFSWADCAKRVRQFALGLNRFGVGQGDVVALIGDNRPDWLFGEIAAHALRAMSLGIYRDALDQEVEYLVTCAHAKLVFAEDEEQVDKLLSLGDRIPSVERIIYSDPRGMRKYDDPRLTSASELVHHGDALAMDRPDLYDELVAAGSGEDVAILCTTSGTTAHPKLAMLQAGPFIRHCARYLEVDPKLPTDAYVSTLPLPWIMEQVYAVCQPLLCRIPVNFVEEPETMMHDFREIGPTFVLFAPRVWEALAADVRARMMDASPFKRLMFALGMKLGMRAVENGGRSWLAHVVLFRALNDRLGFTRLKSAATGGAALGPDTFKFFQAMGVPLRQLYGQTELAGAYTLHEPGDVDFDTVGVPFEGVEVRIDTPDGDGVGEILARNPNRMLGYYQNEKETRDALEDGWMRTGDAGYFNAQKHLVVIDRVSDMATTSAGVRFSPQYIENKLKFSTFISEAVILGHDRDYLAAMVCIRFPIVSKWAEKRRIAFTTYTDLSSRSEVQELIRGEVEAVNRSLPDSQRIRKVVLLYKELDPDDEELTRTRKVRRGVINERYADIIDAIYEEAPSIAVDTTITFQDGTRQRIKTTLAVIDLAPAAEETRARAA